MSEKSPRLRPMERINPQITSMAAHRTMEVRPVLNADQQRRIGQMSINDEPDELSWASTKPFPVAPVSMDDPRDLAENQDF